LRVSAWSVLLEPLGTCRCLAREFEMSWELLYLDFQLDVEWLLDISFVALYRRRFAPVALALPTSNRMRPLTWRQGRPSDGSVIRKFVFDERYPYDLLVSRVMPMLHSTSSQGIRNASMPQLPQPLSLTYAKALCQSLTKNNFIFTLMLRTVH
jgi:hypothetical protein